MGGVFYLVGITIVGIIDTLNNGVEKREIAQERRSERLERNQIAVQERMLRQQQKMADDMRKRQAKM